MKTLLISRYILNRRKYHGYYEYCPWETCTLREWLNNDFLNSAFTDEEKALIPTVTVTADENPEYETDPGNDTQDKIFLLSIDEANNYFNSDKARKGKPTDYADDSPYYIADYWWLRSPGENDEEVALVADNGRIYNGGYHNGYEMGVRPALWIDMNS